MENRWSKIREIHFHPTEGSPYWIERAKQRHLDVFKHVNGPEDFWKLGELTLDVLRTIAPNSLLPQSFRGEKMPFESAGTSGEPVMTYFTPAEFQSAFVNPFLRTVDEGLFPREGYWLYVGPSGPHAVGHAAISCALATSGQRPYTVDFDPRWAKKLPEGSLPAERYLKHICEQARDVFKKVDVSILFITPPVLDALSTELSETTRKNILGIQLAGMAADDNQWRKWKGLFPHARFLIGYGNSLVGVFYPSSRGPGYLLASERTQVRLILREGENRLQTEVPQGERGQVLVHRMDESILYLNLCERDEAVLSQSGDDVFLTEVGPLSTGCPIRKGLY